MIEQTLPLRERKKQQQKSALQRHALELFIEYGYSETTVEQIAEAAQVSTGTFFNYFATKADVVLFGAFDELFHETFAQQPPELSALQALRRTFRTVFGSLPPNDLRTEQQRFALIYKTPELHAAMLTRLAAALPRITLWLQKQQPDLDTTSMRMLAGAIIGIGIAVFLEPKAQTITDRFDRFDAALAKLSTGMDQPTI